MSLFRLKGVLLIPLIRYVVLLFKDLCGEIIFMFLGSLVTESREKFVVCADTCCEFKGFI